MSYRGFILPVSASVIKSIENLTVEELKQYLLNQQADCFEGTKDDILPSIQMVSPRQRVTQD